MNKIIDGNRKRSFPFRCKNLQGNGLPTKISNQLQIIASFFFFSTTFSKQNFIESGDIGERGKTNGDRSQTRPRY